MKPQSLLRAAVRETQVRLKRQADGAPSPAKEVLDRIRENLLDIDFDAAIPSLGAGAAFQAFMGLKPEAYLFLNRMVIAARLLCESEVTLDDVATMAGFKSSRMLHHHCELYFQCSPGQLRKAARRVRLRGGHPRPSLEGYQRCRRGDPEALESLIERLGKIDRDAGRFPRRCREPQAKLDPANGGVFEAQLRALFLRSDTERLRLLRRGVYEASGSAFEALSLHARVEGRRDRRRGVELAEMALALVEGNLERLKDEGPPLLALAWARLGNARRTGADLEGAEDAILCGEAWLERAGKPVAPEAEILALKGSLRLFQRRFDEALELLDEAAGLSEALGKASLLVDVLHQRAAIHLYQGRSRTGVPDLKKAHDLIPATDKRRRMASLQHQLFTHVLSGDTSAPQRLLPQARQLSIDIGDRASWLQIRWIEGLCHREQGNLDEAEPLLTEAREGFLDPKDPGMLAIVSLELGLLYLDLGQPTKVIAHAAEALPALEALKLPEALGAYTLLREAVLRRRIGRSVVEQARRRLLQPGAISLFSVIAQN